MDTYYIRHNWKMDVDQATRDYLWNTRRIAIHYPQGLMEFTLDVPDNDSLDLEKYVDRGRSAMRVLLNLSKAGGYVLAEYCDQSECLIGVVKTGTPIELYRGGKWGNRGNREGLPAVLKALQLSDCQIVSGASAIKLLAGRPKQGTIMRWHSIRNMVENLIEGHEAPLTVRDLIPTYQEVLCAEFLRLPTSITGLPQLVSLILPVGRTLRDVDIYGLDIKGDVIAVQVTLQPSAKCPQKICKLQAFKEPNVHRIFFCDDAEYRKEEGIEFFSLDKVFSMFVGTPEGKKWIDFIAR